MAIKKEREYRSFTIEKRAEGAEKDFKVRGYASTFEPYVLFEKDGVKYSEKFEPDAFNDSDMSDVIFLYNHEGMVHARVKNGTLVVGADDHGLYIEADLSKTTQSRELYEAIDSGLVDKMSFAFVVASDEFDRDTHTRIIHRVSKVYDVSAVSIPANPGTDISAVSARSYFDGVIEVERAERLEREKRIAVLKAKYRYMEVSK